MAFARGQDTQLLSMGGIRTAGSVESLPPPAPGVSFRPLAWAPNSQRLLGLARRSAQDPKPRWMALTLSSKSYEELPFPGSAQQVALLRDGHHIVFSSDQRHGIDFLDTRSGESRMLLPSGRARYIQTWAISPDEKFLFVNRAIEQADIWLATLE